MSEEKPSYYTLKIKNILLKKIEKIKLNFVSWLDNYTDYCWGDLVIWAMFPESHSVWLDAGKCEGCGFCGKNERMELL